MSASGGSPDHISLFNSPSTPLRLSSGFSGINAMVATPTGPLRLSARDNGAPPQGDWGPIQIAVPAIVGGVLLLLLLVVCVIWRQRSVREHSYDYHQVRTDWVTKIERIFVPRRTRQRVPHLSTPVTIDDSMTLPRIASEYRMSRQYRSHSSDSQTPLTLENHAFDYPPPPPVPMHRGLRWWRLFGSRPKQIKSGEPGSRWRVDGPDGSSTGHGHSNHDHEVYHPRYVGVLETMPEYAGEETDGAVIQIRGNITSVSTPMAQHLSDQAGTVRGMAIVPEHPPSVVPRTPVLEGTPLQGNSPMPVGQVSSANRGLPPSYEVSQSLTRLTQYPSVEEVTRLARTLPTIIPPPSRTAMYSPSPRGFHGRDLSSESFLAAQPPMVVATSL